MEIPKQLNNEIWEYCRANNITNIDEFIIKLIKQGFTIEKFGSTPTIKTVEVEKIVEKIIEVPTNIVDSEISEKYNALLREFENLKKAFDIEKNNRKNDLYREG